MKIAVVALSIALVITSSLLFLAWNPGQGLQVAYFEDEIDFYKDQVGYYETRIAELESEIKFYREEAQYWQSEAALNGVVAGQTDRLNEFSSVQDLEQWLANNLISEREWIFPYYDCDDFAMDLTLAALADGYWIGLGSSETHLFNFTIIGNDVYKIEASQDRVEAWGAID